LNYFGVEPKKNCMFSSEPLFDIDLPLSFCLSELQVFTPFSGGEEVDKMIQEGDLLVEFHRIVRD
jgi:hypothetical protein